MEKGSSKLSWGRKTVCSWRIDDRSATSRKVSNLPTRQPILRVLWRSENDTVANTWVGKEAESAMVVFA